MSRPRRAAAPNSYAESVSPDREEVSDAFEGTENSVTSADEADLECLPVTLGPDEKLVPLPTPVQITEAKRFITEQTNRCASIRSEYLEQLKALIRIQERLLASQKLLLERQATISPIRRLPQEVLSMVFLIHTTENRQSNWTLMHVCRAWRFAALTTPALWTRIQLTTLSRREKKDKTRSRVSEGYEVCYRPNQLVRALQRLGSVPLDLWILTDLNDWTSLSDGEVLEGNLIGLLRVMQRKLLRPRLRSLRIEACYGRLSVGNSFDEFDFRCLKVLDVAQSAPELFRKIARDVGDLLSLKAVGSDICSLKDKLSHIEELGLLRFHDTNVESMHSILQTSHSLTALSIQGLTIGQHFKMTMTCLRRLDLCEVLAVWPIVCPNLTHLTIKPLVESKYEDICLSQLVYLSYSGSSGRFLRCFDVPALRTLELTAVGGKKDVKNSMQQVWMTNTDPKINPIVFKLIDSNVNSKILAKVLQAMTNCEELYVRRTKITSDLFSSLLPEKRVATSKVKKSKNAKNAKSKETWWIPARKLRVFVGDMAESRAKLDEKDLWTAASNLVALRETASAPLEAFFLRPKDDGWVDFVKDGVGI
ncbi:hypothetical protein FS842_002487 [Serendipita sp. 407]|nr:hypothetical protein FS842_002487 [Serendipita sp. 407]